MAKRAIKRRPKVRPLRANDLTIRFKLPNESVHQLFKLLFFKDGSLALAFPYFPDVPGIVAVCSLAANEPGPTDVSLARTGKVTSHRVKYTHHWSGEALFSQDRKVVSAVRKPSVRLNSSPGHLFTVQLQQVAGFKRVDPPSADPPWDPKRVVKKTSLTFEWAQGDIDEGALKIVGRAYTKASLRTNRTNNAIGPQVNLKLPNSPQTLGWLFSANLANPASSVIIVLTGERIPKLTEEPGPHLTMIGGFDDPKQASDVAQPTAFLALNYPTDNYERLRAEIGTIDFLPGSHSNMVVSDAGGGPS
jgi:hypothetical protein